MADTALFADPVARTIRGLLLPFGELSAPSVSKTEPVMFAPGTITLPADPTVVTANEGHSQFETRGHAVELTETPAGVVGTISVARTPEGDALLARATDPDPAKRPRLSAELKGLVRNGAAAVSALLTGVAFVPRGAFASAALFALADDEADTIKDAVAAAVAEALDKLTTPPTPETESEPTMNFAVAPAGLQPVTPPAPVVTANGLFAAIAQARRNGDTAALAPFAAASGDLFAIGSIQNSGPAALTIGADVMVPQYINELWSRKAYERKFLPLFGSATLTSFRVNGWRWVEGKTPTVDLYAGNNAEIPSNAVDTEPYGVDAQRIAGGHRVDRRFTDFSDSGFWESYMAAMTEDYARKSDKYVLDQAAAAATAVALGAVPTSAPKGLVGIVDGALAIIAAENTPSFAVVDVSLWRDIVLSFGENNVLTYLSASFGLEEGSLSSFKIIPSTLVGAGKVLVGAKEAATVHEFGGAPIRVEGLVPSNGAVEPALYGYEAFVLHTAKALALVTVPAA